VHNSVKKFVTDFMNLHFKDKPITDVERKWWGEMRNFLDRVKTDGSNLMPELKDWQQVTDYCIHLIFAVTAMHEVVGTVSDYLLDPYFCGAKIFPGLNDCGPDNSGQAAMLASLTGFKLPLWMAADWDGDGIADFPPHPVKEYRELANKYQIAKTYSEFYQLDHDDLKLVLALTKGNEKDRLAFIRLWKDEDRDVERWRAFSHLFSDAEWGIHLPADSKKPDKFDIRKIFKPSPPNPSEVLVMNFCKNAYEVSRAIRKKNLYSRRLPFQAFNPTYHETSVSI